MHRRRFLAGMGAAGAVLVGRPAGVLAGALGGAGPSQVASRSSRLFPGTFLVHADMHNHSLFSDGDGDPALAFESMRDNGLDVAALTDHAVLGGPLSIPFTVCGNATCTSIRGIDDVSWDETSSLAAAANRPDSFVAIRGFEWSSPTLGHMNVWFSQDWIDPERTGGLVGVEGLELLTEEIPLLGPAVGEPLADLVSGSPIAGTAMLPFYDWLQTAPGGGLVGGGADGIVGFNHPGREPGRFGAFRFDPGLVDRVVSVELFNREEDYLFEGTDTDDPSPLNQCLNAGWRPGILGVTDEHGTDWGAPTDKGRGGIWVRDLSAAGVRAGMEERAFFATRERGLRLDASARSIPAGGAPVRMGRSFAHQRGAVEFAIDIDKGADWIGKPLRVQVLRPGTAMPVVADEFDVVVPSATEPVVTVTTDLRLDDGSWVVLRITDPAEPADDRATGAYAAAGRAVAYASPFHLRPLDTTPEQTADPAPRPEASTPSPPDTRPPAVGGTGARLPATGAPTAVAGGAAAIAAAGLARYAARRAAGNDRDGHDRDGHDHDGHGHD